MRNRLGGIGFLVLMLLAIALTTRSRFIRRETASNTYHDKDATVRFFYQPPSQYFHAPLVFMAVDEGDPRVTTSLLTEIGRVAYISSTQMDRLIMRLHQTELRWNMSNTTMPFGPAMDLPSTGNMDITIVTSKGKAYETTLSPQKICNTLGLLDSSISTPRALWEFQKFRLDYGCNVAGFRLDAYPDHYYR